MSDNIHLRNMAIMSFLSINLLSIPAWAQSDPRTQAKDTSSLHNPQVHRTAIQHNAPADQQADPKSKREQPTGKIQNRTQHQPVNRNQVHDNVRQQTDNRVQDQKAAQEPRQNFIRPDFDRDLHDFHNDITQVIVNPVVEIPSGLASLEVNGQIYYYDGSSGTFYQEESQEYLPVTAPVGAIVGSIPSSCSTQVINGINYYVNNGIYFTLTSEGYRVVQGPAEQPGPSSIDADQNSFVVNIPNASGGYTAIKLTQSDKGYLGPQGEFYSQFPSIMQLRSMYGG
jgi:hypothetical protein